MEDKMPNQEGRKFINLSKPISEPYHDYNNQNNTNYQQEVYPQNNYNTSSNHEFNPNAYQQEIYPQRNNNNSTIYKENSIPRSSMDIPTVQPSIVVPPIPASSNYGNYNNNISQPQSNSQTKFCKFCGQKIPIDAVVCTHCGRQVEQLQSSSPASNNVYINNNSGSGVQYTVPISSYSKTSALILACLGFVGIGGIHRLYTGKYGTGIIYLLTGGLCGIGTLIDIIKIASGTFRDKNGLPLKQ
jgi:TM2 domain-containing membrane protein YozV